MESGFEKASRITNDVLWLFISSQSQKHRLPKLVIQRPLGKLDLGDQYWLDPSAPPHHCGRNSLAESASAFLRQIHKRAGLSLNLLHAVIECCQSSFGEAGADPAGVEKFGRSVITYQQRAKIPAATRCALTLSRLSCY